MPQRIPKAVIYTFLEKYTRPVSLTSLDPDFRKCPITHREFTERDNSYVYPNYDPDNPDYPVRVVVCSHIFGRQAIEKHMCEDAPWSHTCPICRQTWVPPARTSRTSLLEDTMNVLVKIEKMQDLNDRVRDGLRMLGNKSGNLDRDPTLGDVEMEDMRRASELLTDGLLQTERLLERMSDLFLSNRRL
ncbi:hypothetical protein B0J11DRAFT_582393 [Dendryphion nanum]|uniref:Uncharacterized protein n=1 Tax=Dendryphion nanum TaxID=256645 RepID=A0A9P9IGL1_9PLEO|nr:hypothetical protein B0J11DRAFT_582393 [Dendryphion nanum]